MNKVEVMITNGPFIAREVEPDLWSVESAFPDPYHLCDIRGKENAVSFLASIVDKKHSLNG